MKRITLSALFILVGIALYAQDYRMELRLRGGYLQVANWIENKNEHGYSQYTSAIGEVYYFVKPKIGIGVNYTRAFSGYTDNFTGIPHGTCSYQHYGLNAMVSTDRTRRFGIYGVAGVTMAEQNIVFPHFTVASKGTGLSLGFGTVLKISRSISFNIFEVKGLLYKGSFVFGSGGSSYGIQVESGLIIKMMREK
ncbi:MAG TPA: hypothetical protein VFE50_01105 [Cyclobacteriaceae bacterium]|nr:hypothetical protein [Cyclobacteriaceae bacterium]